MPAEALLSACYCNFRCSLASLAYFTNHLLFTFTGEGISSAFAETKLVYGSEYANNIMSVVLCTAQEILQFLLNDSAFINSIAML